MRTIQVIILMVLAVIVIAVLSGLIVGVESPLVDAVSGSAENQSDISVCLDQNPDYSYQDCLRRET